MSRIALTLRGITYARYMGASLVALGVDLGVFLLFLAAPLPSALASGLGYCAGIVAQWWLSSRAVFGDRVAQAGPDRITQQALFLVSAGVGLALTMGIVGLGGVIGLHPWAGKIVATGVSFQAMWLLRRHFVFP